MPEQVSTFVEAKSRHIAPAKSVFDFQKGDGLLVKSGTGVVHKIVTDMDQDKGTVTATDLDGGGAITVKLDPAKPARDGAEFKYWIDEAGETMAGQDPVSDVLGEADDVDDLEFDDDVSDEFGEDLDSFLGETSAVTTQIPSNTVGGGVDDSTQAGNDAEDTEDTPAPHDSTGMENSGEVQTMAGGGSSNVGGSAPSDNVATNNSVGGPAQAVAPVAPTKGEHEPGKPDTHESIVNDVDTALGLVQRGANPEQLASRLLQGAH